MAAYEEGACKGTFDSCCGEGRGGWWIHVSFEGGIGHRERVERGGKSNMDIILPL